MTPNKHKGNRCQVHTPTATRPVPAPRQALIYDIRMGIYRTQQTQVSVPRYLILDSWLTAVGLPWKLRFRHRGKRGEKDTEPFYHRTRRDMREVQLIMNMIMSFIYKALAAQRVKESAKSRSTAAAKCRTI